MAKGGKGKRTNREDRLRALRTELWGLLLITLGLCLFLALVSFSRVDHPSDRGAVNLIGPVGVQIADMCLRAVGLCAFLLDGVLFFCGSSLIFGRRLRSSLMEVGGYVLVLPTGAVFLHLLMEGQLVLGHPPGGFIGELGSEIGRSLLGSVGTGILTGAALILACTMIAETNPSVLVGRSTRAVWGAARWVYRWTQKTARAVLNWLVRPSFRSALRLRSLLQLFRRLGRAVRTRLPTIARMRQDPEEPTAPGPSPSLGAGEPAWVEAETRSTSPAAKANARGPDRAAESQLRLAGPTIVEPHAIAPKPKAPSPLNRQLQLELEKRRARTGFELPSTNLLAAPKVGQRELDRDALKAVAEQIEQALQEFKIEGTITGITPGPVVTMYELEPAPGVKLSKIANLSADLARVIKAQCVRIVAPIPGKGVVGLEVPSANRETVYLREILEDDTYTETRAKLPLAIGKNISGKPVVTDLARMPHLLVAGSTGSGKSVAVNAMIMSLLHRASPEEVRMIMVDPKMLELSIYDGIPHLLVPVVTDPAKAATALKWAVDEMERRYHLLSDIKVRNITGYNREVARLREEATGAGPLESDDDLPEHMPYIVIVIDEFADLMMVAAKDVELCVARLAQKARAAGVHLILATQRPSVDVITGLIKANFPTRISFRVFSRVDSRTVLDVQGAENLLGMGDMLFRPPGRGDLVRVHGAYVDEKEIDQVVTFLKEQGEPEYFEEILQADDPSLDDFDLAEVDEMYDLAVELVTSSRKASISMVQRKLRVGYNRAARMIEMMEREAIVGPSDGRGAREVIAPAPPSL